MSSDPIRATYVIETAHPPEKVAEMMAGEQSAGTFIKVPGETPELVAKHMAKVERVTELETVDYPSLPGSRPPKDAEKPIKYTRAEIVIAYPFINVGASVATLMTTVAGGMYELSQLSGIRLRDVEIPQPFAEQYPGPQFGVEGTRKLADVYERPIIGTIIKPSVGFSPEQTADVVKMLCEAGVDFVKDDELQTNSPHSPLKDRVEAVMRVVNDHADKTGKKVMFAFNITADMDTMMRNHDIVLEAGGTCVMIDLVPVGLVAVEYLRRHTQLPIHAHRAGWGMMTRHPQLGMDFVAFQKFFRLAGVDHVHVNGLRSKFYESDESVIASARECQKPMLGGYTVMPVFSSGQWAGQAPDTYEALGNADLIYLAGGGIMAHPAGPAAGVRSLQQGWEAAMKHIPLEDYAHSHEELRQAIEMYGGLRV